jgi:hypothetical protein
MVRGIAGVTEPVDRQNGTRLNVWCRVPGRRGNRPYRPVPVVGSPRPLRQVLEHRLGIDTVLPERLLGDVLPHRPCSRPAVRLGDEIDEQLAFVRRWVPRG